LQGSGEEATFSPNQLAEMLSLAETGIQHLLKVQRTALSQEI